MKNCAQVKEELSAYIDGELALDDARRIEQHLQECQGCCRAWLEFQEMWHYLDHYQLEAMPASHITRFYRQTLPTHLFRRQQHRKIQTRWYWISAAAVLGIFLGLIAFRWIFVGDRQVRQDLLANLEILASPNFEMIADLEILENYEVFKYHTPEMLAGMLRKRRK